MFEGIIFDLGKVLINYSFDRAFQKWAELTNKPVQLFQSHFVYDDSQLHRFERGEITSNEYFSYLSKIIGVDWNFSQFKEGWENVNIDINEELYTILENLQSKFHLYVLSNINEIHAIDLLKRFPQLFGYFEQVFFSHELHSRKPEILIFRKVLDLIKIPSNNLLFIDDLEKNLESAQILGIQTILMESNVQIFQDLKKLGVY